MKKSDLSHGQNQIFQSFTIILSEWTLYIKVCFDRFLTKEMHILQLQRAMTTEGIFVDFFHTHLSINNVHLNYGLVVAQYVIRS